MSPIAKRLDDTDWHLSSLYDFASSFGASVLIPLCSRYVIDLNRPPDDVNLYPGQDTTGLCPIDTFLKEPLYENGNEPDDDERAARLEKYWMPYHTALQEELTRIKAIHGNALLWDAHSIRSELPRFFAGQLTDFNFGTAEESSCAPGLGQRLKEKVEANGRYSAILNGRFKGGYITRAYGRPASHVHAIQLELSQRTYMQESLPYSYLPNKAKEIQFLLHKLLTEALSWLEEQPASTP